MEANSHLGYLPCLHFVAFEHCDHCVYDKHTQTSHKMSLLLKSSFVNCIISTFRFMSNARNFFSGEEIFCHFCQ